MSLSRIFDISRRSLATYQKALDSTAHNVANAANTDFSRRRVVLSADTPEMNAGLVFGTGVRLVDIQRLRDTFADNQIRANNQKNSDSDRQAVLLGQVEQVFNEPTDQGLASYISGFFNSWSQLAVNPASVPLRNNLLNSANLMSAKIYNLHSDLEQVRETAVKDFSSLTSTLNTNLKDIELLNRQIYESKVMGSSSADLEDKRDVLINEISKIVNINLTYDPGGSAVISVGGILAVDRFYHTEFTSTMDDEKLQLFSTDANLPASVKSGELNALNEIYSNKIPGYQAKLDTIVTAIMNSVNEIHQKGYDTSSPVQGGLRFFDNYENGKLNISDRILSDPRRIAASLDGTGGNGDIANQIADLMNEKKIDGTTFQESYSNLVSVIANEKTTQENIQESSSLAIQQMETVKSSTSGVSIDEEMTNMIRYQRSYDASAKLIKAADEILQTLLNMV